MIQFLPIPLKNTYPKHRSEAKKCLLPVIINLWSKFHFITIYSRKFTTTLKNKVRTETFQNTILILGRSRFVVSQPGISGENSKLVPAAEARRGQRKEASLCRTVS